jgi:hypothetical protein
MEEAVESSLATLDGQDRDQAAAELALQYAREIDLGGDLAKLGPALLSCLTALGLTPAARAAALKGAGGDSTPAEPANPLDELRARRAAR